MGLDRGEAREVMPGARELQDARRRGQVPVSGLLLSLAAASGAMLALWTSGPGVLARLEAAMARAMKEAPSTAPGAAEALDLAWGLLASAAGPVLGSALLACAAAGLLQTRGYFSLRSGGGGLPEGRGVRIFTGLMLLAGLPWLAWIVWLDHAPAIFGLVQGGPRQALAAASSALASLGALALALLAALAAGDLLLLRWRFLRWLSLPRHEARRRREETESDPRHRAERRRQHRLLADPPLSSCLQSAALLVEDGGSVAVALAYDGATMDAPRVAGVARGADAVALVAEATRLGVPRAVSPALAFSLAALEEGRPIPAATYQEVADLMR